MAKWKKSVINLPENHGWTAGPGNKVFVADRGAVMFEVPSEWVVSPSESGSIRFFDNAEPDDNIRLEVSVIHDAVILRDVAERHNVTLTHVPQMDWTGLELESLLENAIGSDTRGITTRSRIREAQRQNLEVVWLQVEFMDTNEDRKAYSRLCMARGPGVHSYITIDFWPEHSSLANRVWNGMLGSLKLGEKIDDPRMISRMN